LSGSRHGSDDAYWQNANKAERCGELLIETKKSGERDSGSGGDRKSHSRHTSVNLADFGISYDQSSRWQKLAAVPTFLFNDLTDNTGR
jgi:hypothetical protein